MRRTFLPSAALSFLAVTSGSALPLAAARDGSGQSVSTVGPVALGVPSAAPDAVWIHAGYFTMGAGDDDVEYARRLCVSERMPSALRLRGCASDDLFSNETPARRVFVSEYGIDRYELSRAEYDACLGAGACTPALREVTHPGLGHPSHPMTGISWSQAAELCRFRGGRLPTEAEWERAARGDSARRFPWGSFYNDTLGNHGGPALTLDPSQGELSSQDGYPHAAPVHSFEEAKSPHGVVQMAGNVWEWTADAYAPLAQQEQHVDPQMGGAHGARVVRGGSFRSPAFTLRVTHREPRAETSGYADVGVRCAYDPPAREPLLAPPARRDAAAGVPSQTLANLACSLSKTAMLPAPRSAPPPVGARALWRNE